MTLLFIFVGIASIECLHATPKYSIPMGKIPSKSSPLPIQKYVDFEKVADILKAKHYYPAYEHYYSEKGHSLLPYIVGGFGIGLLPLLTLMLTLAVNIAPAATIPTAITTATGKFLDSFNSTRLLADLKEELLHNYRK